MVVGVRDGEVGGGVLEVVGSWGSGLSCGIVRGHLFWSWLLQVASAIRGGPSAEWVCLVASEEECVGLYNGKAHPCADEACHVRVCVAPLLCD